VVPAGCTFNASVPYATWDAQWAKTAGHSEVVGWASADCTTSSGYSKSVEYDLYRVLSDGTRVFVAWASASGSSTAFAVADAGACSTGRHYQAHDIAYFTKNGVTTTASYWTAITVPC
jgi:hypothetical protein